METVKLASLVEALLFAQGNSISIDKLCEIFEVGKKELKAMIDDGKPISVNCHFCNTDYEFTLDELKAMAREL